MISRELLESYLRTTYRAFIRGERIDIRVGGNNPRLDFLLAGKSWVFLSAENPGSDLTPEENPARRRRLVERIGSAGYEHYPGSGIPDRGTWPPEESLLVAGISESEGILFGREFNQNAILCGDQGAAARLAFCAP